MSPEHVESRADFVSFVRQILEDESGWESPKTSDYLESLAAWVDDWPEELSPSWSTFAKAVVAATIYE